MACVETREVTCERGRMSDATAAPDRRYRRRILTLGAFLFVLCFAISAPFLLSAVESDLEGRARTELADAGITGVAVSFSGQDGTIACTMPLDDPDAVQALLEAGDGVRVIDVDDTCHADAVSGSEDDDPAGGDVADTTGGDAEGAGTDTDDSDAADEGVPTTSTTTTTAPPLDSIAAIIAADPEFSQLAGLLASTGLDERFDIGEAVTLFAPTDAAFDAAFEAIGPDAFASLTSDVELIERLLFHHVTEGSVTSDQLAAGTVEMLDGEAIEVVAAESDAGTAAFTLVSGDTTASLVADQSDTAAANGVIHGIDGVLVSASVSLDGDDPEPDVSVRYQGGVVSLSGVVASEAQRAQLVGAFAGVDPANLDDGLSVDPEVGVADGDVSRVVQVVAAMPIELASGTTVLTDSDIEVTGIHLGDEAAERLRVIAEGASASLLLAPQPVADEVTAADLQSRLNDIVTATPITFEPNSATLTPSSSAVLDRVAATAQELTGTAIVAIGHTDSDGRETTNQTLSEARAAAVIDALAERGLDPSTLSSEGRGQSEPVLVDGVEDKEASRRVEFAVSLLELVQG